MRDEKKLRRAEAEKDRRKEGRDRGTEVKGERRKIDLGIEGFRNLVIEGERGAFGRWRLEVGGKSINHQPSTINHLNQTPEK